MDLEDEDKIVSVALVAAAVADELPAAPTDQAPAAEEPPTPTEDSGGTE